MLFVGLSGAITLDLIRRDPALLERRMKGGPTAEQRPTQRLILFVLWRLLDEERLLARELPGYTDYQARVRYRLVPLLW